jgi:tetratricopeptide (TPR) repeat protein
MLRRLRIGETSGLLLTLIATISVMLLSCSTVPFHEADQAQSLSDAGQYQQAIPWYSRSINLDPYNTDAYLGRGYAYEKLGEYQKALDDYSQVIALKPKDPQSYFVRGLLYDFLSKSQEAIQDYSMAINLQPNNADAYYYRGMDWEKLGNTDAARTDYRNAVMHGRADAEAKLKALGGSMSTGTTN